MILFVEWCFSTSQWYLQANTKNMKKEEFPVCFFFQIHISRVILRGGNTKFSVWSSDLPIYVLGFFICSTLALDWEDTPVKQDPQYCSWGPCVFLRWLKEMCTKTESETKTERKILKIKLTSKLKNELSILIRLKHLNIITMTNSIRKIEEVYQKYQQDKGWLRVYEALTQIREPQIMWSTQSI